MQKKVLIVIATSLLGVGCATIKNDGTKAEWAARRSTVAFTSEKSTFKSRLSGKMPCWNKGIVNFTLKSDLPTTECIYPSGAYGNNNGKIAQAAKVLKVIQSMPAGFLVSSSYEECGSYFCHKKFGDNLVFIHKTDQSDIVDGSLIDPDFNWDLYEYVGPFSYESLSGRRTIHSFRKVPLQKVKDAYKDLKVYDPYHELYADINLWPEVRTLLNMHQERISKGSTP